MVQFANNPHAVYNGLISGQRNMFLTSSIAVAMVGFSNVFEKDNTAHYIRIVGASIFIMSIFIGIKSANDFIYYLDKYSDQLPQHIPVANWYKWAYVNYIYSVFLMCIDFG